MKKTKDQIKKKKKATSCFDPALTEQSKEYYQQHDFTGHIVGYDASKSKPERDIVFACAERGMASMKSVILQVENLQKSFSTEFGVQHILKDITVDFYRGDFTAVMGESGSGKSTFLYSLSGLDRPTGGKILFGGQNVVQMSAKELAEYRKNHCGFIFQKSCLIPGMTVWDNVLVSGLLTNKKKKEVIKHAEELFDKVEISPVTRTKYPSQISGGRAQRVGIVRALINTPELLLADEPTGALNSKASGEVLDVFTAFNREGQSIIMVTHDVKSAIRANRVLYLKDGVILGETSFAPYTEDSPARIKQLNDFLESMRW